MLNIDISEVVYKNKQIDVSIEIVLVRCLTSQRAEKNYSCENRLHCNWQENSPAKYLS